MEHRRVLLIDDETDFLDIMGQRIESWGYEVILASSGEEAMDALMSRQPDAIVLDYIMPDINGIELLKKIRDVDKKIPVIMFTAKPKSEAMEEGMKLKISAFIPKLSKFTDTQKNLKAPLDMIFKRKERKKQGANG